MTSGRLTAGACAALLLACAIAAPRAAAAEDLLAVQAGGFGVGAGDDTDGELGVAWRPDVSYWWLKPHAGVLAASDGTAYGYAGVLLDIPLWGSGLYLVPSTAVGLYHDGSEAHDLGGPIQFRSGLDILYRLDSGWRVGVGVYHISNAGIYDHNPGEESVLLTVAMPLGRLF